MGKVSKFGIFSPAVIAAKVALGESRLNKIRGKVRAQHLLHVAKLKCPALAKGAGGDGMNAEGGELVLRAQHFKQCTFHPFLLHLKTSLHSVGGCLRMLPARGGSQSLHFFSAVGRLKRSAYFAPE